MKVVLIDTHSTADFDRARWPQALRDEADAADVVIGLFAPHGPLVLKGEADVSEWRMGRTRSRRAGIGERGCVRLDGSADPEVTAAQNPKLLDHDGPHWYVSP